MRKKRHIAFDRKTITWLVDLALEGAQMQRGMWVCWGDREDDEMKEELNKQLQNVKKLKQHIKEYFNEKSDIIRTKGT